jgi:hypothetical protein
MPFLQIVNGKYRVRIVVPPELRPYLPLPHTGKANLTRTLGTGNQREANRLAVPWIADFQAAITSAASITENPHGYDWITRYRAYHRGQNRFPPEGNLFSPQAALAVPEAQTKPVPFHRIILLWAKQTNAPKKGKQDMETKCGRFAEWLGHEDMARVCFENCRDYRDAMIDESDLSSGSILNHLKLLKALFTYAFDNEHITSNPMARIKYSAGERKEREDFTPEERKRILILACKAEPHVHWVNWVCSFLGTRTSEVADASTLDIECIDGIWIMNIDRKHRSRDQRLKTKVSTRKLALHRALLDEGFLDYWRSLPPGGPLFPNVPLDTYGKRASSRMLDLAAQRCQDHRSEQTVLFAPAHRDFLSAQHPPAGWITSRQRGHRALHPRPCGQGGACWLWQAVVRNTEGGARSRPEPARGTL